MANPFPASMNRHREKRGEREHLLKKLEKHLPVETRSWDAAQQNKDQAWTWSKADGRHINSVLVDHLETVQQRSLYEVRANPIVEGTIETHKSDVVGKDGPKLQVQTDDDSWNDAVEIMWREEFASNCDGAGQLSIGDFLKQELESLWSVGTILSQIVDDVESESATTTKLHPISARRLATPWDKTGDPLHILGVERNKLGRHLQYYITEEEEDYRFGLPGSLRPKSYPARDFICEFRRHQPGQVLGFPLLASSLQTLEDLRGYDQAVMDAAKTAAILAVLAFTTSDQADIDENALKEPKKLVSGAVNFIPDHYQFGTVNPNQPANNHVEYRSERQRELGRPVGMPLMQIRLDSSGHNYSSARFDGQIYHRANQSMQSWLERRVLNRVFRLVLQEAMLLGLVPSRPIQDLRFQWNWDQPPHVDPVKEAMAERIRLENKTLSPQRACASHGEDFETIAKDWDRANSILEQNGLPPMLGAVPGDLAKLAAYLTKDEEPAAAGTE